MRVSEELQLGLSIKWRTECTSSRLSKGKAQSIVRSSLRDLYQKRKQNNLTNLSLVPNITTWPIRKPFLLKRLWSMSKCINLDSVLVCLILKDWEWGLNNHGKYVEESHGKEKVGRLYTGVQRGCPGYL
jgi:hypothetical protein